MGRLVRSNSPYVDGQTVTLFDVDIDALLKDEEAFTRLQSARTPAETAEALKQRAGRQDRRRTRHHHRVCAVADDGAGGRRVNARDRLRTGRDEIGTPETPNPQSAGPKSLQRSRLQASGARLGAARVLGLRDSAAAPASPPRPTRSQSGSRCRR